MVDFNAILQSGTSIANSIAAAEAARQNAKAAAAVAKTPAPAMTIRSGIPPILIAVAVIGLGVGGFLLIRRRKGGRRR